MGVTKGRLDPGRPELAEILDIQGIQALLADFHRLMHLPVAVVDCDGQVLAGVGWQPICTGFHRVHPETRRCCTESDTQLTADIAPGEFRVYKCKNCMWDASSPIVVDGQRVGNVFVGQFFYDDEVIDTEQFRAQAKRYQFDEKAYLAALESVPRFSRETIASAMSFFVRLASMLSEVGRSNQKLSRAIRERDALVQAVQAANERLRESDRNKDAFLAALSHELRNPLAPISNAVYLLQRSESGSEASQHAQEVIGRQVTLLSRLVDDLLDVTRISRNKIQLQLGRLDFAKLVDSVCEDHRLDFERVGVSLIPEISAASAYVSGDANRLAQAVGNLLHNAAKFTESGDSVRVRLSADPESRRVVLEVADTGIGMTPATLARLFQPFVQADESLDRAKGGLGLGLALVHGIVRLHGGDVTAFSPGLGRGSRFVISLPLEHETAPVSSPPSESVQHGRGRRILIIEDNPDAANTLCELLQLDEHQVSVAHTGAEGLEQARFLRPEVVLCDLGLPGMDGFEVARQFRADPALAGTYLVALSGYTQPRDLQQAVEAGFDRHFAKPADPVKLTALLAGIDP